MARRLAVIGVVVALTASAAADAAGAQAMWNPFVAGTTWRMTSDANGHVTTFGVKRLTRWGCSTGEIVDLWDHKQAPEDYWQPGLDQQGHQILRHDRDGSWRLIGTYTDSPTVGPPPGVWTLQIHGYPGQPRPYVITPGVRRDSDVRTRYWAMYSPGVVSACMGHDEANALACARNIYWRSRFRFTERGDLVAHYEEMDTCGALACQIENWTFARGQAGIARLVDHQSGGRRLDLVLQALGHAPT